MTPFFVNFITKPPRCINTLYFIAAGILSAGALTRGIVVHKPRNAVCMRVSMSIKSSPKKSARERIKHTSIGGWFTRRALWITAESFYGPNAAATRTNGESEFMSLAREGLRNGTR